MMKRLPGLLLTVILVLPLFVPAQNNRESTRITRLFNFDWKFQAGNIPDAQAVNFDDKAWRNLDLPHDFQIEQPWDQSAGGARGFKAMGEGWYRKSFKVDPAWKTKKIVLDFEGIMLTGEVWLNGKKIGDADYGYLGFEADISRL